ncbi:MAG TPA: hypothetical protein DCO79_11330 [Spirochaeta sp.]|nr:hypothetical protein [Spirochaeta sp.]
MDLNELKKTAVDAVDADKQSIFKLSKYINAHPEAAYEERLATVALIDFLSQRGFKILTGAGGLETAFIADFGSSDSAGAVPVPAAIIAEYDALPGVGHGCGHNLIAAAAAGAGLGVAAAIQAAGSGSGSAAPVIRVIGTPAEEIITEAEGKIRLIEAGVFKQVGSTLMFHPWGSTGVAEKDLGFRAFRITFTGRTAHAAADPWNGLNALDAAVIFYNSISMLRQQTPSSLKIHCVMPEAGTVLNVIPEKTVVEIMLRSPELEDLISFEKRIVDCTEAAAKAAGCDSVFKTMTAVKPVKFNRKLFELAAANMEASGEHLETLPLWQASSDFGDLSHEVPSLSLLYGTHDKNLRWHSRTVAEKSAETEANEAMLRAAKILAMTAIDILFE